MPPASSAEREEERRLNMRTLTIASAASATAAAVTSQLWIAGTWLAAALTPVLVALLSEAMHRPTERIARAWTSEREPRRPRAATPTRAEPSTVTGTAGPVRVYRQTSRGAEVSRPARLSRRRIAIGTVAATAAIAFVVGIVALTTADLVSGGSVGKGSGRTTLLGGRGGTDAKQDQQRQGSSEQEQEQQQQQQQQQQQSPDSRQTTTPDEPTSTQPAPEQQQPQPNAAPVPPPTNTPPGEPAPQPIP